MINVERITVGPLDVNCYVLWDEATRKAIVVDPGAEAERILERIEELGVEVELILNTHGHVDHIGANKEVRGALGCPLALHEEDIVLLGHAHSIPIAGLIGASESPPPDRTVSDGEVIELGLSKITLVHTPGHTQGSVCLLFEGKLLTGDTLFCGAIGRSDLPGGDELKLMDSIKNRLLKLPNETVILPGHAYGPPKSTIGEERASNPFLASL